MTEAEKLKDIAELDAEIFVRAIFQHLGRMHWQFSGL